MQWQKELSHFKDYKITKYNLGYGKKKTCLMSTI